MVTCRQSQVLIGEVCKSFYVGQIQATREFLLDLVVLQKWLQVTTNKRLQGAAADNHVGQVRNAQKCVPKESWQ